MENPKVLREANMSSEMLDAEQFREIVYWKQFNTVASTVLC